MEKDRYKINKNEKLIRVFGKRKQIVTNIYPSGDSVPDTQPESIMNKPVVADAVPRDGETLVYNEEKKRWESGDTVVTLKVGDVESGNYAEVDANGTIRFNGEATFWDDLLAPLIGENLQSPSARVVVDVAEGTVVFEDNADLTDYVFTVKQLSHNWKLGSDLKPHLHWIQTSSHIPNWLIQYRWQVNGEVKTTDWTSMMVATHAFTYTSGSLNQISGFGTITAPATAGLSDLIQIRILRDTANDSELFGGLDPLTGDVHAYNFDIHIECDSLGSNEQYVKD